VSDIAARTGILLCGPNCVGAISTHSATWLFLSTFGEVRRDVPHGAFALASQSGGLLVSTLELGHNSSLGFSYLVSTGNEAGLTIADYCDFFLDDSRTKVVGTIVEGFRDPTKFAQVAEKALRLGKPIVVLKTGRSEAGKRAVASHTAALAGSHAVQQAFFKEAGVTAVRSIDELVETAIVFSKAPLPEGRRFAGISLSGGGTGMLADLADDHGLQFGTFSDGLGERLRGDLSAWTRVSNPLDTGDSILTDSELFVRMLTALFSDDSLDLFAIVLPLRHNGGAGSVRRLVPQILDASKSTRKPVAVIALVSEALGGYWRQTIIDAEIPFLQDVNTGLGALSALARYAETRQRVLGDGELTEMRKRRPAPARDPDQKAAGVVAPSGGGEQRVLVGREAKNLVDQFGVPINAGALSSNVAEARSAASKLGYPIALKAASSALMHGSDFGLVRLDIRDEDSLNRNYTDIVNTFAERLPTHQLDGITVEEMVAPGVELIVGVQRDPDFGHVVLVGLGGVLVEYFDDVALRLPPISRRMARDMVGELRSGRILDGVRGRGPADIDAVVSVLDAISGLVRSLGDDLVSLDINPLIVHEAGKGATAVDCAVVLAGKSE